MNIICLKQVKPLLLTFIIFALISCSDNRSAAKKQKRLAMANCNFDGIKTGDIILKKGMGKVSNMIVSYFKEKIPLSHCAILVCNLDSTFIVHSVAKGYARKDGVQTLLLDEFMNDCEADYFYIVRQKASDAQRELFAQKAMDYAKSNIAFDEEANNENKDAMSCTELIYWCQKDVYGKSDLSTIKIVNKDVFVFNGLLDTSRFQIIKHF